MTWLIDCIHETSVAIGNIFNKIEMLQTGASVVQFIIVACAEILIEASSKERKKMHFEVVCEL